jgi:hypothetical protein
MWGYLTSSNISEYWRRREYGSFNVEQTKRIKGAGARECPAEEGGGRSYPGQIDPSGGGKLFCPTSHQQIAPIRLEDGPVALDNSPRHTYSIIPLSSYGPGVRDGHPRN